MYNTKQLGQALSDLTIVKNCKRRHAKNDFAIYLFTHVSASDLRDWGHLRVTLNKKKSLGETMFGKATAKSENIPLIPSR